MKVCSTCRNGFKIRRPKCECPICVDEAKKETPTFVRCVFCCYAISPSAERPVVYADRHFLCLGCADNVHAAQCICCKKAVNCGYCCPDTRHRCCKPVPIEFTSKPLSFAYPCINKDRLGRNVYWLDREASEDLLGSSSGLIKYKVDPKGFNLNSSRRFAAVELEVLSCGPARTLNSTLASWNCCVVEDNSMLRGYNADYPGHRKLLQPFEINTAPACGDVLPQQLYDICTELNKASAEVYLSCGIHVHVDCRDFGYQELQRLIKIYCAIEDTLFASVHPSRYRNEFCSPCGKIFHEKFIQGIKPDTKGLKSSLISGVYGPEALTPRSLAYRTNRQVDFHNIRADHYGRVRNTIGRNPMRYSALNLHSYFLRGTVESRIHHGSTDFAEIWSWVKILLDIFDSVTKISEQKLEKILTITDTEIQSAVKLISCDNFIRTNINRNAVASGVVVLRSLLSDDSFEALLEKIFLSCINAETTKGKVLPCQRNQRKTIGD